MKVGFTGSQHAPMRPRQLAVVIDVLFELCTAGAEFHHGCNRMRDDKIARIAKLLGYRLVGHPPTDKSKVGKVVNDYDLPDLPYLERNHRIVDDTDVLIAAPLTSYEQLRSGTWSTVRFAAKRWKPGLVVYPNGLVSPLQRSVSCALPPQPSDFRMAIC